MKRIISMACIIASVVFVLSKPLVARAASATTHASSTVSFDYFLGSATAVYDWNYIYGQDITFSTGYAYGSGLCISADTYMYDKWDERVHFYATVVMRGLDVGGSYGGSAGGTISWNSDTFYAALTAYGICNASHDKLG